MKVKTIEKTIRAKITEWIGTLPEALQETVKRNTVVTGGAIASMLLKEKVNDYDVYFKSPAVALEIANYYISKFVREYQGDMDITPQLCLTFEDESIPERLRKLTKEDGATFINIGDHSCKMVVVANSAAFLTITGSEHYKRELERVEVFIQSSGIAGNAEEAEKEAEYQYFETVVDQSKAAEYIEEQTASEDKEEKKYSVRYMSSNAITLSDKMQLILRFCGEPDEIHETYDFVHATNYWTVGTGVVTNTKALEALLARELIYTGSRYPLASMFRLKKFIARGWTSHVGNQVKMALQLNELDLFEPRVLEEQLTGMDMAYMHQVISAVKTKRAEDPDFEFNATYLCEIVDRLMG